MRTKKNKAGQPQTTTSPLTSGPKQEQDNPNSATDTGSEKPNRISFNLTSDNSPDWDRMLPKTKEQLRSLLLKKDVQRELGIDTEKKTDSSTSTFGALECNGLFDLLELIEPALASKLFGVPIEVTSKAFEFNDMYRKKGSDALTPLMNKWAPFILKTWKDEIGALMVLGSITGAQVRAMYRLNEEYKIKHAKNVPLAKAPQPIRVETPPAPKAEPEKAATTPAKGSDILEEIGLNN